MTIESKLLGPCNFVPRALAGICGRTPAAFLQQLHYSLQTSTFTQYGETWVCRSLEDWAQILDYSVSTVQRSFSKLEAMGLVIGQRLHKHYYSQRKSYRIDYDVLERLTAKCDHQSEQNDHLDQSKTTSSNKRTLKPDSKKQQTDSIRTEVQTESIPTHHPVNSEVNERGNLDEPVTDCKGPPEINPELETEIVQELGHKLAKSFKELIASSPIEVVKDALVTLRTTANIRNKSGFLRAAIQNRFKPSANKIRSEKNRLDPDFKEWFDLMKQAGLAMASERREGALWIHSIPGKPPTAYEEMRSMFSMTYLKRKAGMI